MDGNNNPWLALSTYEEKDEYRFKGRDSDTANVLTLLHQNEYVVCYAASGDGKSSLINAGVCPKIRREGLFPIKIVFTSDEYMGKDLPLKDDGIHVDFDAFILSKIEQGIASYRDDFAKRHGLGDDFTITFEKQEKYENVSVPGLWWKLRTETIQIPFGEFNYIPVLIFDQFEELFQARWKAEFFSWLEELSKDICPQRVAECFAGNSAALPGRKMFKAIFSLRYEYVGELDYWCSQKTYVPQIMQNRYFLKPLTRSQAMEVARGQDTGGEVTARIAADADLIVDSITSTSIDDNAENDEIPAIILSLVCYVLFEEWSENNTFSLDSLSLNGLIYEYYRSQLAKVGVPDEHRIVLEDVLISRQNTRLRVAVSDPRLEEINIGQYLAEGKLNIVSVHIVKIENINGEDYLSIIHDKLVDAISVYREERIRKEKEEKLAAKNRAIRRRMRIMVSLLVVVMAIVGGLVYMFFEIRNQRNGALMTQSRFVTKEALELYESGDYLTSLALMAEVYPHDVKHPDRPLVDEAYYALKTMVENIRIEKFYSGNATLSPDGSHVLVIYADGRVKLVSTEAGVEVFDFGVGVNMHEFSPKGDYIAVRYEDGLGKLVSTNDGLVVFDFGDGVGRYEFSPEGDYIAVKYEDGRVKLVRTEDGKVVSNFGDYVDLYEFSPDGSQVIVRYADGRVKLVRTEGGVVVSDFGSGVERYEFSSGGDYIVVESKDGGVKLVRTEDGRVVYDFGDRVIVYELSPDGDYIAVRNEDGRGKLVRADDGVVVSDFGDRVIRYEFSPDGDYIAVSSKDGGVKLVRADDGVVVSDFRDGVDVCGFSPDGDYIVVIYEDRRGKLVRTEDGREMWTSASVVGSSWFMHIKYKMYKFSPDGDYIAMSSKDGGVKLVRTDDGVEVSDFGDRVVRYKFSPDGDYIAVRYEDGHGKLVRPQDGVVVSDLGDSVALSLLWCTFSPDGDYIAVRYEDGRGKLVRTEDGVVVSDLGDIDARSLSWCTFSPDGDYIAVRNEDGRGKLVRTQDGIEIAEKVERIEFSSDNCTFFLKYNGAWTIYNPENDNVYNKYEVTADYAQFNSYKNYVLIQNDGDKPEIIDICSWKLVASIPVDGEVLSSEFAPNGEKVILSMKDTLFLFDIKKKLLTTLDVESTENIISMGFSKNGEKIFALNKRELEIFDAVSGKKWTAIQGDFSSAEFSPDGSMIFTNRRPNFIIWNCETGDEIENFGDDYEGVTSVTLSHDWKMAAISSNGYMIVQEVYSNKIYLNAKATDNNNYVYSLTFSPDSKYIIIINTNVHDFTYNASVLCWRNKMSSKKRDNYNIRRINAIMRPRYIKFSADASVVILQLESEVVVYDMKSSEVIASLPVKSDWAMFGPDGKTVVTVNDDTASLWDVSTGNFIMDLKHNEDISSIQFSHDGRYILACSDRSAKIWTLPDPQELIDTALSILNDYKLPVEDRRKYYLD